MCKREIPPLSHPLPCSTGQPSALAIQCGPHRKAQGPGTEMGPGREARRVGMGRFIPASKPSPCHQMLWLRCAHSLSSHSCLQGTVTGQAVEMSQELPVRSGTQPVRSGELGPPAGWVANPALLPGDSPGANHPLQAHILNQLASSVALVCASGVPWWT